MMVLVAEELQATFSLSAGQIVPKLFRGGEQYIGVTVIHILHVCVQGMLLLHGLGARQPAIDKMFAAGPYVLQVVLCGLQHGNMQADGADEGL